MKLSPTLLLTGLALTLFGCATTLEMEKHAQLKGAERNEVALKVVDAKSGEKSMDDFFPGDRVLKNACIVGFHNRTVVNDNTLNYKTTVEGLTSTTTTKFSFNFKPSPAFFQKHTDFAYKTLVNTLKRYGYNVIDPSVLEKSQSYISKGEAGNYTEDMAPQYSGYFDLDPKNIRRYDRASFGIMRLLGANDEWATQFHKETDCELMVNFDMISSWKLSGTDEQQGAKVLEVSTGTGMILDFNVPWPLWKNAAKKMDKTMYGAVNYGGSTQLKKDLDVPLIFPMGANEGVAESTLEQINARAEKTYRDMLAMSIDYQIRAFHLEVYTKKPVPEAASSEVATNY